MQIERLHINFQSSSYALPTIFPALRAQFITSQPPYVLALVNMVLSQALGKFSLLLKKVSINDTMPPTRMEAINDH